MPDWSMGDGETSPLPGLWRVAVLALLAFLACGPPSAPAEPTNDLGPAFAPPPSPAPPPRASEGDATCREAIRLTVEPARALHAQEHHATPESIAYITEASFECAELPVALDLDRDGVEDVAVTLPGGATMPGAKDYFLFLSRSEGPTYVGHVRAHPVLPPSCALAQSHGLCDVYAGELMIHGEEDTHVYRYDGTLYRDFGVVHSSPPEPM